MTSHRPERQPAPRRRRAASLRLRITAGAMVLVAAAFALAGFIVLRAVEDEMTGQVDRALRADADFTSRVASSGSALPMSDSPSDLYAQFVDGSGTVVGSGTAAAGRPSLVRPGQAHGVIVSEHDPVLGPLRVVTVASPGAPEITLVLARSSAQVVAVHDQLLRLLVLLTVVGTGLVGALVWRVVGRSLRPVEAMRSTVAGLSAGDLDQRVVAPGTGDELDRLAGTLNELLERLETARERERRFVADASHDLRTPVAATRALVDVDDPNVGDGWPATRADAVARLDQLQSLIDQLLALASADAGAGAPRPGTAVDLDDLVLGHAQRLAKRTGLTVDTTGVSGGQVNGRDTDLDRLIDNLASNAARHARSVVTFAVVDVGDAVELTVSDDGPGIAAEQRAEVFERFRTFDAARSGSTSGTGLGLAIVASIADAHGATIDLDDAPGGGARFIVRFPTHDSDRAP